MGEIDLRTEKDFTSPVKYRLRLYSELNIARVVIQ